MTNFGTNVHWWDDEGQDIVWCCDATTLCGVPSGKVVANLAPNLIPNS